MRDEVWRSIRDTEYGARFRGFEDVPLAGWEDLAPWHERQRSSGPGVILSDRPKFYEKTSGSTGPAKQIPYTQKLRESFNQMFHIWAYDLLCHGPAFTTFQLYFSISPRFDSPENAEDGRPVGTQDDRDYLAGWTGLVLRPFWRSPDLRAERDPEHYRQKLARYLLTQPKLEVFSVWSPSFLTVLLDWMEAHRDELPETEKIGDWAALWPELKLISCWDEAGAAPLAARLRDRLPRVLVQGKGLLCTEAPVTVPLVGIGAVPLVGLTLIELLDDHGLRPVFAAEPGKSYEVVISQTAGIVRYRLGDRVECTGRVSATPILRFIGRDRVIDGVGEKLTEADAIQAFRSAGLDRSFACLIAKTSGYVLVVDRSENLQHAAAVDAFLCTRHHYRLARQLGQLRPVVAVCIPDAERRSLEAGAIWGGTKLSPLRASAPEFEFRLRDLG